MNVKFIGFGGSGVEYPCYQDENKNIYFDINHGRGTLDLHTGAYRHPGDNEIWGEPISRVYESIHVSKM